MPATARLEDIEDSPAAGTATLDDVQDYLPEVSKAIAAVPRPKFAAPTPDLATKAVDQLAPRPVASAPPTGEMPGSFEGHPENIGEYVPRTIGKVAAAVPKLVNYRNQPNSETAKAATDVVSGAGEAMAPFAAIPAIAAPVSSAVGLGIGAGASELAGKVAHGKVSPETEELIRTLAFWAPGVAGEMAGIHGIAADTGEGKAAGVSAFGGKVAAGAKISPEEASFGAKVGPFKGTVRIPRGGTAEPPQPAIEPPTIEGQIAQPTVPHPGAPIDHAAESASNMGRMQEEEAQAMRVVSGLPPTPPPPPVPPPPGPPIPPEIANGHISPETVQKLGKVIAQVPPELRAKATLEAHQTLSQSILQQGKVVTPDGSIEIVTKPEQADKVAQRIINDEVKRQEDILAEEKKPGQKGAEATVEAPAPQIKPEVQTAHVDEIQEAPQTATIEDITGDGGSNVERTDEASGGAKPGPVRVDNGRVGEAVATAPVAGRSGVDTGGPATSPVSGSSKQAFQKGDQVVLPDGTKATVQHVHPTMSIVRVRSADGKNVSIGARKLTKADSTVPVPVAKVSGPSVAGGKEKEPVVPSAGAGKTEQLSSGVPERPVPSNSKSERAEETPAALAPVQESAPSTEREQPNLIEPQPAKTYFHGDAAEYTGKTEQLHGGTFHEIKILEGHLKGQTKLTQRPPSEAATLPETKAPERQPSWKKPEASEIEPGKVGEMKVSHLNLSPHEFQYKLGTDAEGVGTLLKETKVFNPDLAGQISVWKNPKNDKFYVVNGHHRYELAKRTGTKSVAVRHIKASDAVAARAIGAQQNIAEGRGTALDAAKYFRDTGTTAADLAEKGISLGEATAKDGLALSHLDTPIFNRVVSGDLRPGRAIAIGEATTDPAEQKAILSLVEKKEAKGGKVSDDTLSELIRMVKGSEQTTETTADLFGTQQINRSLALEKAEISAHIKQQLAKDKKLFGFVAKGDRATELARAGNKIDVEKSQAISTGAAQAEEVYNKLSSRGGPISSILDESARRLADGENAGTVKSDAYQRVRTEVSKTLGGSEERSVERPEGALEPQRSSEAEASKPEAPVEPTLPGMEHVPAERAEANAEQQGKDLTDKLSEPPKSIEAKAGEIEQQSPLFRDTEANPQRDMFGELLRDESGSFEPGKLAAPARTISEYLKNEIETNKQARELHSGLSDLDSQYQADVLRAVHTMEQIGKELGKQAPKDFEQIYHHLEDPEGVKLSPAQDKLLDETILPVMDESNRVFTKLTNGGVPAENYVHRVVKGKGGFFDRIIGGSKGSGRGNLLQKSSPQQKHRTMMVLEQVQPERAYPEGPNTKAPERRVVSIKSGMVTAWKDGKPEDMGGLRSGLTTRQGQLHEKIQPIQQQIRKLQHERRVLSETPGRISITFERRKHISEEIDKLERERDSIINDVPPADLHDQRFVDKQGREWEITQATTKEIERSTSLKYYHNALASALVSYLQLRKAERGFDFIEAYKNSPEFAQVAQKQGEGNPPDGWKSTDLPQLRGYYFEPHTAEVLDHYAAKLKSEGPNIFDKIGQFLRTSIFFNPLIHTPNIAVHWAVEKGVPRGFAPTRWGRLYKTSVKAINAVTHQNQDFLDALDAGAPLQSQREDTAKITQLFFDQLTDALGKEEDWATKLAKGVGMSPVNLIKAIYKFSGKVTWVTNDIAFLQAAYEKTAQGMALKDALKETAKHIPDYRLPVRIFNSTGIAKLMSNPTLTMFGAYHYGALKSYGEMAKSALGAGEPPPGRSKAGEAAHGWELLAGIGLVTFVLYPLLDELAKKASGDPNARVRRAGAATLPYNLYLAAKHEKSAAEVAQSVVTPAVHTKTALELGFNRDFRTGRQIYDPAANWKTQSQQVGRRLAEAISPVGQGLRVAEDEGARKRFVYGLGGVSFPLHGAEKIASEIAQTKMPTQAEDPKERQAYYTRRAVLDALRKGDNAPLEEARKAGSLTPEQIHTLMKRSKLTPLQDKIHGFSYVDAMRVYDAGTPEQKKELDPIIREKRQNLLRKHRGAEVTEADRAAQ